MNMAKLAGDHVEKVIDHHNTARQQTPPVFDINASIYVFERRFLIENTTGFVWDGKCGMYQMFDTGIIDIDSEEDYLLMEAIAHYLYATYPAFGPFKIISESRLGNYGDTKRKTRDTLRQALSGIY
mgnify:CR=1 FL=1